MAGCQLRIEKDSSDKAFTIKGFKFAWQPWPLMASVLKMPDSKREALAAS